MSILHEPGRLRLYELSSKSQSQVNGNISLSLITLSGRDKLCSVCLYVAHYMSLDETDFVDFLILDIAVSGKWEHKSVCLYVPHYTNHRLCGPSYNRCSLR